MEDEFTRRLDDKIRDCKEAIQYYLGNKNMLDYEWAKGRCEAFDEAKRLYLAMPVNKI